MYEHLRTHLHEDYRPLLLVACALVVPSIGWTAYLGQLPDVKDPAIWNASESWTVKDRNGQNLYFSYTGEDRIWVEGKDIPDLVKSTFLTVEDRRFWSRSCIDWRALGRAGVQNVRSYKSQGASTITQQLVRTAILTREKTFTRKFKEIVLACQLENTMSKEDILTHYLNWISFGGGIAGIHQASEHLFDKNLNDLTVAEVAVLASMPQRPTYFSPYGTHRYSSFTESGSSVIIGLTGTSSVLQLQNIGRAHQVVATLLERGSIDEAVREKADAELMTLTFKPKDRGIEAPFYVLRVLDEAKEMMADVEPGTQISVDTTIDIGLQRTAENIVLEHATRVKKRFGAHSIAVVLADLHTREILAYVGNADYFGTATGARIDMATVPRQPGSSMKPIVYAAAMQYADWSPVTVVLDTPLTIGQIRPRNYAGDFDGKMTVIKALNHSRNIPAIRAFQAVGEENVLNAAEAVGASQPKQYKSMMEASGESFDFGWPLAIGAAEIPLTQMVQAYGTFGNGGVFKPLRGIRSLQKNGETLPRESDDGVQAIPAHIANAVTAMLSEKNARPEGYWRTITDVPDTQEAVKTGTSNVCLERGPSGCKKMLPRDTWAIGYTPEFLVGVWVGNSDGTPLTANADGLNAAVPIWKDVLIAARKQSDKKDIATSFRGNAAPYYQKHPVVDPSIESDPTVRPSWISAATLP